MGEELEIYILKKLDDAITESNSSEFHFAARLFLPNLHKDFTELRELIEKKRTKIRKAAAAAASKKESTTGPSNVPARPHPRPAVRDAAANVAKIPVVSKASAPAATTAKEESKVFLSAGGVKKSEAPRDAADEKKIGAPADAGDKKDTGAPLDSGEGKKDAGALSDAGGYKKDTGAPLDAGAGDKKDSGAPLDAGNKKDSGAPLASKEDKKDAGALSDAGGHKDTGAPLDAGGLDAGDKKDTGAPLDSKEDKKDAGALLDADGYKKGTGAPLDAGDKKNSGAPLDAGDEKESGTPLDSKEDKKDAGALSDADGYKKGIGASLDAGDKKDSGPPQDAGDEKESGTPEDAAPSDAAPSDAGDKKETDTPLDGGDKNETDAASDVVGDKNETDAAGDKKESSAPSDATCDEKDTDAPLAESAKKESDAPLARTYSKTTSPDESKASAPARAYVTSGGATDQHESDTHTTAAGGGKKESNVGTSAKSTSQDESEISPATDAVTGDKSITPPAAAGDGEKELNASKTATLAKTSTDESEISPVTDDDATDHKSKTPTFVGDGKKESGVPPDVSNTVVTKPVNEENLLREQLYYLNNVLTEWQMITKKPFSYSSDSLSSMKDLSKTLKKIKQDLKPETTKKTEESSHSGIPPTPEVVEYRWSTRLVNLEKVYGFEDKILSLERLLVLRRKDTDTFKAFGIHGMAGVGKTTLCQSIFSGPKVSKYFFPRIWVCLSKQKGEDEDNKKEVVKRMLRCLGIDDKIINKVVDKQGIRGLLFALRLQLTGKRYLIVLDDAHNADEWFKMPDSDTENDNNKIYEKFSYGLPKECGGTVIVTSRVEQVVKNMVGDEENLRCIEPLTDEDTCWKIFKDTVEEDGTEFPEDLNLNTLKLEIVKRCDGLPLAAKLLGQIKHKELVENPTLAGTQRAAVEAGNHQAAIQAGNQQAAVQAAK